MAKQKQCKGGSAFKVKVKVKVKVQKFKQRGLHQGIKLFKLINSRSSSGWNQTLVNILHPPNDCVDIRSCFRVHIPALDEKVPYSVVDQGWLVLRSRWIFAADDLDQDKSRHFNLAERDFSREELEARAFRDEATSMGRKERINGIEGVMDDGDIPATRS